MTTDMERLLDPGFWIERAPAAGEVILDQEQIRQFNARGMRDDDNLADIGAFPERISAAGVTTLIRRVSHPYDKPLYFHAGGDVETADYTRYEGNLALDALPAEVRTRFGLVARRTDMRAWPTTDTAYKNTETIDLDRFQENGLFPGDAVAILHESRDGDWWFAQSYNYAAWVRKDNVALTDRETLSTYLRAEPFLVVTGSKVRTNFNPHYAAVSELQLDMGVRLPLARPATDRSPVDGQNPYTSYTVRLPVRQSSGDLEFHDALVARSQDVRLGYLDFTRENIIRQGFKFLGERYGWGHSYNARDCSGLVTEVYKSFGILLPRNTLQQVESPVGETIRLGPGDDREARLEVLSHLDAGDLIYSPGHVMIYVGSDDGQSYVLHDTSSSISFLADEGQTYEGILNGVSITPFLTLKDEEGLNYLDTMWAIKKVR
jgi:cell wall-associated NlpC family hydrolase